MKTSKLKNAIIGGFELPVYHTSAFLYGSLQGTDFVSEYNGSVIYYLSTFLFFGASFLVSVDGSYRLAFNKSLIDPWKSWIKDKKVDYDLRGILKQIDNAKLEEILKK